MNVMKLYKNGFIVAELDTKDKAYEAWPLAKLSGDNGAKALTDEAYDF